MVIAMLLHFPLVSFTSLHILNINLGRITDHRAWPELQLAMSKSSFFMTFQVPHPAGHNFAPHYCYLFIVII